MKIVFGQTEWFVQTELCDSAGIRWSDREGKALDYPTGNEIVEVRRAEDVLAVINGSHFQV